MMLRLLSTIARKVVEYGRRLKIISGRKAAVVAVVQVGPISIPAIATLR